MKTLQKADCGAPIGTEEQHAVLLGLLDALAAFCKENGLRYYLSGGTLLGAVRHKGFIPWDDDIDVVMPRPDIKKLMALTGGKLGRYRVTDGGRDPWDPATQICRLYDLRYVVANYYGGRSEEPFYHPISIDICPIDGFPESEKETKRYCRQLKLLRKALGVSWHDRIIAGSKKDYLLHAAAMPIARLVGYRRWRDAFQKLAQKYDFDTSVYVGTTTIMHYLEREKMPKEAYITPVRLTFEGKEYDVPGNYEYYLTRIYGDYMQIPPADQQKTEHEFRVYRRVRPSSAKKTDAAKHTQEA